MAETVPLLYHLKALHRADRCFYQERDRRYSEVAAEREKALKYKEAADQTALELARAHQHYLDVKANELREQIASERGLYATMANLAAVEEKLEAIIAPLAAFVATQQGNTAGVRNSKTDLFQMIASAGTLVAVIYLIANGGGG